MFASAGDRFSTRTERFVLGLLNKLRRNLQPTVRVTDKKYISVFTCDSTRDLQRALSLWLKEEGTMQWIDREVCDGDVFMDIGANIGIYTIAAAHRVGSTGRVIAFEPHKRNALALMQNLALNSLTSRVDVVGCPLSDKASITKFEYLSLDSASSGSQVNDGMRDWGHFIPVASELTTTTTVDRLLAEKRIRAPSIVKIDVDGLEPAILRGMSEFLSQTNRPRTIQVEINVGQDEEIRSLLYEHKYKIGARHFTAHGLSLRAKGVPESQIVHNAVFFAPS
jgi:FkbM family methyltransferase